MLKGEQPDTMGHPLRTPIVSFHIRGNGAQCHGFSQPESPRTPLYGGANAL